MKLPKISRETWLLAAMTLLAIAFKGFLLWQRSAYLDPDESYYMILARNLATGHGYTMNGLPNIVFPPLLPALIALVYFVVRNLQLALGIISAVSGGLLGLVAYKIGRSELSPRYALAGSFLVLFIYPLNAFARIGRPYTSVLYRGSDTLNALLILALLWMVLRLIRSGRVLDAAAAGLFAAMAYLTRPEGFLLGLILAGLLTALSVFRLARMPLKLVAIFIVTFVSVSSPYLIYLKSTTGQWMLSGKIAAGQDYRTALLQVIKHDDWEPFIDVHYALDSDRLEMRDQYFGYHGGPGPSKSDSSLSLKTILENWALAPVVVKVLFLSPLLLFFAVGFVEALIRIARKGSAFDLVLLSVFIYSVALIALSYPIPRHHLFLVPVFCLYAVFGVRTLLGFLRRTLSKPLPAILIGAVVFASFASDYVRYYSECLVPSKNAKIVARVDREIGAYLRARGGRVVMSNQPGFAVRASSDWQVLPMSDFVSILKFAAKKKVDYILMQESAAYGFRIIETAGSIIPASPSEEIALQVVEPRDGFALVRVVKAPGREP